MPWINLINLYDHWSLIISYGTNCPDWVNKLGQQLDELGRNENFDLDSSLGYQTYIETWI